MKVKKTEKNWRDRKSTFLDGFNMGTGTAWDVDDLVVLCGGTGGGLLPDNNLVPIMGKRCC